MIYVWRWLPFVAAGCAIGLSLWSLAVSRRSGRILHQELSEARSLICLAALAPEHASKSVRELLRAYMDRHGIEATLTPVVTRKDLQVH
jgi:hypothetical protein